MVIGAFLLAPAALSAEDLVTGKILEKIICAKDPAQTYALYLPSGYSASRAWPVIFCFDPGARGVLAVKRLQPAAEKYGYIVAASLTSRNGPWDPNVDAAKAMIGDVDTHLHLDAKRVYLAGLSGGARVACQLAQAGFARGVIACSAGFAGGTENIPDKIGFAVYGTAGFEDFNYKELKELDQALDARHATHHIAFFEGPHEWPPAPVLDGALEWLELQAMVAGVRPRDDAFVQRAWQAHVAALPAQTAGAVWRANKELAADFKGLVDVSDAEKKAAQLVPTAEVKDYLKAERAQLAREESLANDISQRAMGGFVTTMQKKVAEVRQLADAKNNPDERRLAERVLAGAAMMAREGLRSAIDQKDYETALALAETAIAVHPEVARNYFDLARVRALGGDPKRALTALQAAAEKGFSDAGRTEAESAFGKMKTDPAFQAALAKIRANPPEPKDRDRQDG